MAETPLLDSEARVALVTGAARGIGAATVRRLSQAGLRVVAVDACAGSGHGWPGVAYSLATSEQLETVAAEAPGEVLPLVADVRDRGALQGAVTAALEHWGRLDVVVAAAAVVAGGEPLWETSPQTWDTLIGCDATGVWNTIALSVPHLLASPDPARARVVLIASAAGERGLYRLGAYVAAKHAVIGLMRGLAADLVGTDVSVAAISPGSTSTDMLEATAAIYGVTAQDLVQEQSLPIIDPAEIAELVQWCVSDAGRIMHGSILNADGGFSG